ncbi:CRISPR-associated endoribonuclease Cas6 [Nitrososphaera viennensis]|uniref:CRISPR-associated endoribonuclease Cas6 n=2 Tax=Nitrososphaera viennensis TaxID=1034015 RepID=A0A060HMX8_9ARCH|nr:CRISPR-associated endoribonuclease Cas6 [Nitrososphaera viennensis]AIC16848.1 CRISPR-associated endoribonuclease Cas6 [Nitrososphaera viennensis EN76]UVS68752.1 CRISPR-associated endoribonuclease Cas6 [Nitrososphaera viennensis]
MRFSVTYDVTGPAELPIDYRAGFVSLIKTALDKARSATSQSIDTAPLSFAIRFDRRPIIKDKKIIIGSNVRLYVSSASLMLGTLLYNSLLSIKEFPIYDTQIANPLVSHIKEEQLKRDCVIFATLSPIVIRHYQKRDQHVLPNEEGFTESFQNALSEEWALHNGDRLEDYGRISFEILKFKKVVMTHYGGLVLGFTGVLRMDAAPHVLKFFYQAGIGYRRSNGFGFVEVDVQ